MSSAIPIPMLLSGAATLKKLGKILLSDSRGDVDTGEIYNHVSLEP